MIKRTKKIVMNATPALRWSDVVVNATTTAITRVRVALLSTTKSEIYDATIHAM